MGVRRDDRVSRHGVHRWLKPDRRMRSPAGATASAVVMSTPEAAPPPRPSVSRNSSSKTSRSDPERVRRRATSTAPPPQRNDGAFRIVHTGYLHTELGLRYRRRGGQSALLGGTVPGLDILRVRTSPARGGRPLWLADRISRASNSRCTSRASCRRRRRGRGRADAVVSHGYLRTASRSPHRRPTCSSCPCRPPPGSARRSCPARPTSTSPRGADPRGDPRRRRQRHSRADRVGKDLPANGCLVPLESD